MDALFACCIRPHRDHSAHTQPTETTHLLGAEQGPSTPVIDHQPTPHPGVGLQDDDEELDAIFGDMIGTMVRPKQANPFLTGTAHTPNTSRNPSPRSLVSSQRGGTQRSQSRGRTTNAFQVRRVRMGRNGAKVPNGPDAVQEEEEQNGQAQRETDGAESTRTAGSDGPTRASTQNRDELERRQYTIKLKTDDIVKPWRSQISGVD